MSVKKGKGPVFDPGLCRCCGSMKKCRVLNVVYECMGEKVIYSDMMMDCFGLLLSHLDGKPTERLICATCVMRLRDAFNFRKQALQCEEAFLQMKMYDGDRDDPNHTQMEEALVEGAPKVEIQLVKVEPSPDSDPGEPGSGCEDDAGPDYEPPPDPQPEMEIKPEKDEEEYLNISAPRDLPAGASASRRSIEESNSNDDTPLNQLIAKKPNPAKRPNGTSLQQSPKKLKLPMSKVQQLMRERDPSYMTETNILTIVEFSYVCPFKCRHNHLLCYYCGQNFADPIHLREHTEAYHHPKKFKVTEHKNMIKIDLTRIDCRLCSETIDSLDKFKQHITTVHDKKYYFSYKDSVLPFRLTKDELKCAICMKLFPYFHALNKHMNEHYSNYVCETCGLGFVDKGRFVMHQQRHDEGDFPCETCGKIFKAQYNRDLHIDRVHKKKGRVYCPKCDIKLMSYPQKLKHLVEVHGEAPLSFPCSMCDKIFETRRMLTIHRRKDHLKDYRYECQCCGQKFFTRFALNNHMPTHTGERNFKCKVCEKCYPRLKTLKDHMRIHTNDRRYRCHICGQAFIQNCSLKGHMKSQHPEY